MPKTMRASEMVALLEKMIEEHGDCVMFSEIDWDVVRDIRHAAPGEDVCGSDMEPGCFVLSWDGPEGDEDYG